ncbi:putative membrane protein [Glaesserella parasuis H465]|nr:putative membrane protein [Glaesserella parasuis H465]
MYLAIKNSHKKICTLISWLFSPTFGVQIIFIFMINSHFF